MGDSSSPNTFIPQLLSVHTFDEEAFRVSFGRQVREAARALASVAVVLGAVHVVLVIVRGRTDWFDGLGFVLACTCACAVFVAVIFLVGYWWSVRFGRVTRVALHHEWGGIALALLKRSVPEDAMLEVALSSTDDRHSGDELSTHPQRRSIPASQEVIVPASAGATRRPPKTARLGAAPR